MSAHDNDNGERAHEIRKRVYLGRLVKGMYDWYKGAKKYEEWWTSAHYDLLELDELLADDELNLYAKGACYRTHMILLDLNPI